MSKLFLMLKGTPIMEFDRETGYIKIIKPDLLPYSIKNCLHDWDELSHARFLDDVVVQAQENALILDKWLRTRVARYTGLYPFLNNGVHTGYNDVDKLIKITHGISPDDYYSIVENVNWETFKPMMETPYSYIKRNIDYYAGDIHKDLFKALQKYSKAPIRYGLIENKMSKLYTKFSMDGVLYASKLSEYMGVNHTEYRSYSKNNNKGVYRRTLVLTDSMFVTAADYFEYCKREGKDFIEECYNIDEDAFNRMLIFDYLTGFRGRAGNEWGFVQSSVTGEITRLARMFKLDKCFRKNDTITKEHRSTIIPNTSMYQAAKDAVERIDYKIMYPIGEHDFKRRSDFQLFFERAKEIGCI